MKTGINQPTGVTVHKNHAPKRLSGRRTPQPTPGWGKGKVKIGAFSSLRKLMRAARRGLIPDERQGIITRAMEAARKRQMEAARKRQDDNRRRNK